MAPTKSKAAESNQRRRQLNSANRRIEDLALGQHLNDVSRQMEKIKTCCFFFDLKMGCKLIALFEGICGVWQAYNGYRELYVKVHDSRLAPQWLDAKPTQHNTQFDFFMGLIAVLSSLLLLTGVFLQRKICVLIWVNITALCTLVFMLYTLVIVRIPELIVIDALTAGMEAYFIMIAFVYYMQMQRAENTEDDFEVLFTTSEA